jgi:hypothetical protein
MNSKKRNDVPLGFVSIDQGRYQIEYFPEPVWTYTLTELARLISKIPETERNSRETISGKLMPREIKVALSVYQASERAAGRLNLDLNAANFNAQLFLRPLAALSSSSSWMFAHHLLNSLEQVKVCLLRSYLPKEV